METKKHGPHGEYCGCNPDGVYVGMGCPNPNRPLQFTKQTAVEWFVEKYFGGIENVNSDLLKNYIEQAKQMEKEQIIDAYKEAEDKWEFFEYEHRWGRRYETAEKYYNETYKQ